MKTKTVLRYYCDHCSKGYFKKPSALRHEGSCVANPKRGCGLCGCTERDYVALVKTAVEKCEASESPFSGEEYRVIKNKQVIDELYSLVDGCPTCLLAVLVQAKIAAFDVFNYKDDLFSWYREQSQGYAYAAMRGE